MEATVPKLVVAGPMGAGKSTLIRSLADTEPVSTEMPLTDGAMGEKTMTTVALDFATVMLDDDQPLLLYGLPGQDHFSFMRPILLTGAVGAIVLLDGCDAEAHQRCAEWLQTVREVSPDMGVVIGVTRTDVSDTFDIRQVRRAVRACGEPVPIMTIDARDREQAAQLVRALLVSMN